MDQNAKITCDVEIVQTVSGQLKEAVWGYKYLRRNGQHSGNAIRFAIRRKRGLYG